MAQLHRLGLILDPIPISVDHFRTPARIKHHFLSHAHSDHCTGLTPSWGTSSDKIVYCTEITARVIQNRYHIGTNRISIIRPGRRYCVCVDQDDMVPVIVEVMDANHCPGAVAFVFKIPDHAMAIKIRKCIVGKMLDLQDEEFMRPDKFVCAVLFTGDFRFEKALYDFEWMRVVGNQHIDCLYLDDTYLDPEMDFPSRDKVALDIISFLRDNQVFEKGIRVFIGIDTIGKEELLIILANEFSKKVVVNSNRYEILDIMLSSREKLESYFTCDSEDGEIFVVSKTDLTHDFISKMNSESPCIGILPSAYIWRQKTRALKNNFANLDYILHETNVDPILSNRRSHFTPKLARDVCGQIHHFPYSLHSSFSELCEFVKLINPGKVIPITSKGDSSVEKYLADYISDSSRMYRLKEYHGSQQTLPHTAIESAVQTDFKIKSQSIARRDFQRFQFSSMSSTETLEIVFGENSVKSENSIENSQSKKRKTAISEETKTQSSRVTRFGGSCDLVFQLFSEENSEN